VTKFSQTFEEEKRIWWKNERKTFFVRYKIWNQASIFCYVSFFRLG
jgi:hypothetical protein